MLVLLLFFGGVVGGGGGVVVVVVYISCGLTHVCIWSSQRVLLNGPVSGDLLPHQEIPSLPPVPLPWN